MITYINSDNAKKYSRLFSEAEAALAAKWQAENKNVEDYFGAKDPETGRYENGISSLNTYFSWINDLLNISSLPQVDENGIILEDGEVYEFDGMKFSMLPVDEEVFSIDANTRQITVPAAFTKNGISVQGDEISEVVYFKINRFYDATDLFNQDIMVEWIAPSGLKGYSVPTVKVLDDTTDFVIFGWALASAITETAGNVTFSVRFYKYDDDNNKIQYSLSTLTQTAKIQPNIGLDIAGLLGSQGAMEGYKVLGDEIKALIKERSENSNFGLDGDKAEVPAIYHTYVGEDEDLHVVVLEKGEDGKYSAKMVGLGYSNDAGMISYFWKKFDYFTGSRVQTDGADKLEYDQKYEMELSLVEAEALAAEIPAMKLYIKETVGEKEYIRERTIEEIKGLKDTEIKIYCNDTYCILDGVGYYKLVVKNRNGRATETFESDPIVVYPPVKPDQVTITNTAFLDVPEEAAVEAFYVIDDEPDIDPAYALIDPVKVGYRDNLGALLPQYAYDPSAVDVHFEWLFIPRGATEAIAVDGAESTKTLTPTLEGDYFCRMKGLLNGAESDPVDTGKCRVTYKPARPIFTVSGTSQVNGNNIAVSNKRELTEEDNKLTDAGNFSIYVGRNEPMVLTYSEESMKGLADHQLTDELTCQWYCYELQRDAQGITIGQVDLEDAKKAMLGTYEPVTRDSINWLSDRKVGDEFKLAVADLEAGVKDGVITIDNDFLPERDGYYFCVITNKYNDKTDKISTPLAYYDNQND